MKILPTGAISRLGIRLSERRRRSQAGENPALTETDYDNITEFEKLIGGAIKILELENEALERGDARGVADLFESKTRLLNDLTIRQPVIEPFLKEDVSEIAALRGLIRELAEHLHRNSELLQGMATASRTMISEIERMRKRQSLDGIYDKTGQRLPGMDKKAGRVVKNL